MNMLAITGSPNRRGHEVMIIESMLRPALAAGLILVHNHPSGHCQPSPEDRQLTESITKVAGTLDIRVLDHLIVGRLGYYSFAENKLL